MGDSRRAEVFARWITTHFPQAGFRRIADVASGNGDLGKKLSDFGYSVSMYDKRRRGRYKLHRVHYKRAKVEELFFRHGEYDLVVGMHPDEATWHAMRLAALADCPFAIVPCCAIPPEGKMIPEGMNWLNWLRLEATEFGFATSIAQLHFQGKNLLLIGEHHK